MLVLNQSHLGLTSIATQQKVNNMTSLQTHGLKPVLNVVTLSLLRRCSVSTVHNLDVVVIIVNILFNIFTVIKELPNLHVIVRLSERWETGGEGNSECGRIDVYSQDH